MRRRDFIQAIGVAAVALPLPGHAQQAGKRPIIGFLGTSTPSTWSQWTAAFEQRLGELGWIEGRTVDIEYRWAEGRNERYVEIAAEFVHLKVDVIVTSGAAVLAAKQATTTIPIVFAIATDPIRQGFVASLARPGRNITGLSIQAIELAGKRLGLMRELLPKLGHVAVMTNVGYVAALLEMGEVQKAADTLGIAVVEMKIRQADDIAPAFEAIKGRAEGLIVVDDPLTVAYQQPINSLALAARLPTVCGIRERVSGGGLMSYGPNFPDLFRRTAEYVDKIFHGARAATLPIEQPSKFDLIINLTTAKTLGIDVPQTMLARANEVIG
jgi:putative ABC transport system substrate-binding protein